MLLMYRIGIDFRVENEPETNAFVPTKRLKGKSYRDAVDEGKDTKLTEPAPSKETVKSTSGPSRLIPEVVIPVYRKAVSASARAFGLLSGA